MATPHTSHHAVTKAALEAGKHVLCEEPLTINAGEAGDLVRLARNKSLFLMEAVRTRFLPSVQRAAESSQPANSATSGGCRLISDFQVRTILNLGCGGALMDRGVYPLPWALISLGRPRSITGISPTKESIPRPR